jgi:Leucine-rich repeat (LRR) protein
LNKYLTPNSQVCGFKIDGSKNSSEINFDFPVDGNTGDLTFIYTTTSIPILPAELFRKFSNKTLGCGLYKLQEAKLERDWFKHSGNLEHLFFGKNQILKLEGGKFVDLKKLDSLNLRRNWIKEIDKDAFAGLEKLRKLYLDSNQIDSLHPDLFRNLVALAELNLSWNKIENLDGNLFIGLRNLRILFLHHNKLQQLPPDIFKDLVALTELSLSYNEIKEVDVNTFGGLKKLGNSMKKLDENSFVGLKDLKELNLIGNQLKMLPEKLFDDLTSLKVLNLGHNPIESLSEHLFSKLLNLIILDLKNGLFETLPEGLFKNNGNLTNLYLGGKITKMSNKMFSHLKKLRLLDLVDNHCISMEIYDHNSNIAFTEEILIPCTCIALKEGQNNFKLKGLSALKVFTIAIILFVLALILFKMLRQSNFQPSESFLVFKNGE